MAKGNGHGGTRPGAGRPKGSRNRRSTDLADRLQSAGRDPIDALTRIAEAAEADGDLALAASCWKAVVTYVYPKPKPVETDPELAVELARATASAKRPAEETGERDDAKAASMLGDWIEDMLTLAEAAVDFGIAEKLELSEWRRPKPSTIYEYGSEEETALADAEWARREEGLLERRRKVRRERFAERAGESVASPADQVIDLDARLKTPRGNPDGRKAS